MTNVMPYTVIGRGAHAVVFVHGFLDGASVWDDVIAKTSADVQAIAVDLAGMGGFTHAQGPYTLERYADDVAALVAELGKPVVLVGQSMGAQIVELVARKQPELVAGLMLLCPVPLGGVHAPPPVADTFKALGGDVAAQRQVRGQLSVALDELARERLVGLGARVTREVTAQIVDAWNNGLPIGLERSAFTGPVLLVRGAGDGFVTEELVAATAQRFADATTVAIPDVGHWTHVEQPAAVAAQLDAFLAQRVGWRATATEGLDWRAAFAGKSTGAFRDAIAEDVVLDASVLALPVAGREAVGRVMGAASAIYEHLEFTQRATAGSRQYLEWTARAFEGIELRGVTVLTRNALGQIAHIAIHHRPLGAALRFNRALEQRLREVIPAAHFEVAS